MTRSKMGAITGVTALALFLGSLVGCTSEPVQRTGAEKCHAISGTVFSTEDDGDVKCNFRTQRRYCKQSGEKIVAGGTTGWKKETITCQKELDSDFDNNDS